MPALVIMLLPPASPIAAASFAHLAVYFPEALHMSPCCGLAVLVPYLNRSHMGQSATRRSCSEESLPMHWAKAELSPKINECTAEGGVCSEALSVVWLFHLLQKNSEI